MSLVSPAAGLVVTFVAGTMTVAGCMLGVGIFVAADGDVVGAAVADWMVSRVKLTVYGGIMLHAVSQDVIA